MTHSLFHILNISRQDMMSRMTDLDVASNNIANINTAGYKSSRANFQELLTTRELEGVRLSSTQVMTGQGNLKTTENPLDLAIQGDGFFQVTLPNGKTGYTRDGEFTKDSNGKLVTASGATLNWSGTIPTGVDDISFAEDGTVKTLSGGTWTTAGTISLARFTNPTGLTLDGNNIYLESTSSGTAQTGTPGATNFGTIASKSIEMSNVDLATEYTHLMTVQRNFQMSTRTFQQTDEMINEAIHMRKV